MYCNQNGVWDTFVYAPQPCNKSLDEIIRNVSIIPTDSRAIHYVHNVSSQVTVPENVSAEELKTITQDLQMTTSGETAQWASVSRIAECMANISKRIGTIEVIQNSLCIYFS